VVRERGVAGVFRTGVNLLDACLLLSIQLNGYGDRSGIKLISGKIAAHTDFLA
jgi:hypothetical protein